MPGVYLESVLTSLPAGFFLFSGSVTAVQVHAVREALQGAIDVKVRELLGSACTLGSILYFVFRSTVPDSGSRSAPTHTAHTVKRMCAIICTYQLVDRLSKHVSEKQLSDS